MEANETQTETRPTTIDNDELNEEILRILCEGTELTPDDLRYSGPMPTDEEILALLEEQDRELAEAEERGKAEQDRIRTARIPPLAGWNVVSVEYPVTSLAFWAWKRVQTTKALFRKLSSRVFRLKWEEEPVTGTSTAVKKFPFTHRDRSLCITKETEEAVISKRELFHPTRHSQTLIVPECPATTLPSWGRLSSKVDACRETREALLGARLTAVAFDGPLTPDQWKNQVIGEDCCFASFDLRSDLAVEFLKGENGGPGAALSRGFVRRTRRKLERSGVCVIWSKPFGAPEDLVRVMVMVRGKNFHNEADCREMDAGFHCSRNLQQYGIISNPVVEWLEIDHETMASYLGVDPDKSRQLDAYSAYHFTPGKGFATNKERQARYVECREAWRRFAAHTGLPSWFSPRMAVHFRRSFLMPKSAFSPAPPTSLTRTAQRRRKFMRRNWHARMRKHIANALADVRFYKGSPAQLAALACRTGEYLGDYCTSEHKAGRAKELYGLIRQQAIA